MPPDFKHRSDTTELLDRDDIPFSDISRNMEELETINSFLGGHRITREGLKQILRTARPLKQPIRICEIGCGGGDNLKVLASWLKARGINYRMTGIDINPHCIRHAQTDPNAKEFEYIVSDYRDVSFTVKPDILFSSLFCHHFSQSQLVSMLRWMKENSRLGFFINDLHRHPVAYQSIRMLTGLFSKSYLVKNDAPISVLRGFRREDWESVLASASIGNYRLMWKWAFRWLLVVTH